MARILQNQAPEDREQVVPYPEKRDSSFTNVTLGSQVFYRVDGFHSLFKYLKDLTHKADVVSLAVFDTVLGRYLEPPEKLEEVVCGKLTKKLKNIYEIDLSPNDLRQLRRGVELKSANSRGERRRSLPPPLSGVVKEVVLRASRVHRKELYNDLVRFELEFLDKLLYVREGIAEILQWLSSNEKRVIALVETHLDKDCLKELFARKSLSSTFDGIYASSNFPAAKNTAEFFQCVLESESIAPHQLLHIGNDKRVDYKIPKKMGINSIYVNDLSFKNKKRILRTYHQLARNNPYWRGRHLLQLIGSSNNSENFYYNYGFSFLGPVFSTFIHGVVELVKKYKIEQVFFLAREGELFLKIFEIFTPYFFEKDSLPILTYAYVSRKSVGLAALHKGMSLKQALLPPLNNPKHRGLLSILLAYTLPPEEFRETAAKHGFDKIDRRFQGPQDHEKLKSLLGDQAFQEAVISRALPHRELVERYLGQLGFFRQEKVAVVDVGWLASIQKLIQDAFIDRGDYPHVYGLYMGFRSSPVHGFDEEKNTIIGILGERHYQRPDCNGLFVFQQIFEQSARAFHPTTVGYRENEETNQIEPVLKKDSAPDRMAEIAQDSQIRELQEGMIDFSIEYVKAVKITGYSSNDIKSFIATLIERCMVFPTKSEVRGILSLRHSEDFGTDDVMDWPRDNVEGKFTVFNPKKLLTRIRNSHWPYGTALSTGIPGLNLVVRLYSLVKQIR